MRYELRREGEDRLYATGDSRLVWIDRISGKPTPWPDSLRQLLPSSKTA
jgi:acyl-CoA thioester hydrolase